MDFLGLKLYEPGESSRIGESNMSTQITIGQLTETLARSGKYNAGQIVERIKRVFPNSKTTKKTVYSVCSVAKIHLPGSNKSAVDMDGLAAVLAELEPVKVEKTGTDDKPGRNAFVKVS